MGKGRKRVFHAVFILLSVLIVISAAYIVYLELKPMVADAVTVEAGETTVDIKKFLIQEGRNGSFFTEIKNYDLKTPGVYDVKIEVRNRIYNSKLIVVDTTAPKATAVASMALKNEIVKAEDFVQDVKDVTQVKISFKEIPDTSFPGEQEVTVVLEDTSGNRTELASLLTVLDIKSSVQVEAGKPVHITPVDFMDNDKYSVSFVTDVAGLDTSKPARHEILINVDGRILTSYIDVIDTTPPVAGTQDLEIWKDEKPEAASFVTDIDDVSKVKASYKVTPDFSAVGSQNVTILLEDDYGNTSELTAKLTVKADTEPPVITGVKDITVYQGESVSYKKGISVTDNKDTDMKFEVDSSNVNTKKAGTYEVYYTAQDLAGNKTTESAAVTVLELVITDDMLNEAVDEVLKEIVDDSMTKREKAYEIYKWVRTHVDYTGSSDKSDWKKEAYRGIKKAVGDCFTYYAVSEAFLTRAGIENMRVTRVGGRTKHYWNLINCGDGWYHFDACPHKDKKQSFMMTDAEVEEYTKIRGNNYYVFDKSLYPATPEK